MLKSDCRLVFAELGIPSLVQTLISARQHSDIYGVSDLPRSPLESQTIAKLKVNPFYELWKTQVRRVGLSVKSVEQNSPTVSHSTSAPDELRIF